MNNWTSLPVSDLAAVSEQDWQLFYHLTVLASGGAALTELLDVLADHLDARRVLVRRTDHPAPDTGPQVLVTPLHYRKHYLGDLMLDVLAEADRGALAPRLAFFAPVIALALGPDVIAVDSVVLEERDRLEAVLEATNNAILVVTPDQQVTTATRQFETFTGIPRHEILGRPVDDLIAHMKAQPGLPAGMINMLRTLADNQTDSLGGEVELSEPAHRVLVWYSLPVHAQYGPVLGRIFAFRDATRERELDRMKSEFIMLVSHELRTPLTSIKGFSELILDADLSGLAPDLREYMVIIGSNADRLVALINDILDVTRIDTDRVELNPRLCSMEHAINQAIENVRPDLEAQAHTLRLDIMPDLPQVWADPVRMIQIVTNLLTNAIKYTPDPGTITVQACYWRAGDELPPAAQKDQIMPCVMVAVQDTGIGISPDDQQHLFERFYRAKTKTGELVGGTGLGLSIVKAFVNMHGGQVWFDSEPGVGSTFTFTVPVVEAKARLSQ
jgi:signal transduction histidine kinase